MRRLPTKRSPKQKLIIKAVEDYYGLGASVKEKRESKKLALWLMGRKKGVRLSDEEIGDLERIRVNLQDKVYTSGLADPQLEMRPSELNPIEPP